MGRPAPQYIPEALNVERFRLVLGCSALRVPPKMGPKSVKMVPPPKKKVCPDHLGCPSMCFQAILRLIWALLNPRVSHRPFKSNHLGTKER